MFQKEQMETIFSNIEDIYRFSRELLDSLEAAFVADAPQTSQIGNVFLKHVSRRKIETIYTFSILEKRNEQLLSTVSLPQVTEHFSGCQHISCSVVKQSLILLSIEYKY